LLQSFTTVIEINPPEKHAGAKLGRLKSGFARIWALCRGGVSSQIRRVFKSVSLGQNVQIPYPLDRPK